MKPSDKTYNHIAKRIVKEIRTLETQGISIGDNIIINGSLINVACDNLGANAVFGFTECFVANYFCRYCECDKSECQMLTKENKRKMRIKTNYDKHVKLAQQESKK